MKYVMITSEKIKFILNEKEKKDILNAIFSKKKQIIVQGEIVPIQIPPTIIKFERWYAQENERLALTHHRLCKRCLSIISMDDKCSCWEEQGRGEKKNAIVAPEIPESVKDTLKKLAEKKSFPRLDNMKKDKFI